MMNSDIYQKIFDELDKYLIKGWKKLIVYLEYGKASYSFSFYEQIDDNYIKCYEIPEVSDEDLDKSFRKIDDIVSKERKTEKDIWTNMTMVIDSSGKMKTDFDYTDLSAGTYQYKKNWKTKYLV